MSTQRKVGKSQKGCDKKHQILHFAEQLKFQIKKIKSMHSNIDQWQHIYKHFKQLYVMIDKLVDLKKFTSSHQNQEKLPQFFEPLHQTTIDMRMKLLADLGRQQNRRKRMQQQYIAQIDQLKKQLENKSNKIIQLQRQAQNNKNTKNVEVQTLNLGNQESIQQLKKQRQKLIQQNKMISQKLKRVMQAQKILKNQLKKCRQRPQPDPQISEHKKKQTQKKTGNRKQSPSPDRFNEYTQVKTSYQNVLGSFSQIPNEQNYTHLDNTDSHQQSERKVKSVQLPLQNIYKINGEQFWRFLLIQASTIQQIIDTNQ